LKNKPPPIKEKWSAQFQDFVSKSLTKDPKQRPSADELLEHEFLAGAADHKQEFAKIVQDYCVIHAEKKKKQK
jgi:serine/threonine-protein kinase 24/25/MST4